MFSEHDVQSKLLSFGNIEIRRTHNKSALIHMSRSLTACKAVSRNCEVKSCTGSRKLGMYPRHSGKASLVREARLRLWVWACFRGGRRMSLSDD